MREVQAVVVFQNHKDVACGQIFLRQALAQLTREITHVHRNRLAVEVTQALNFKHRAAHGHLQAPRHHLGRGQLAAAQHLGKRLVARGAHGLAEAL